MSAPMGGSPCGLGREGSAFAGGVGAKLRGVEPAGGAGLPPGIIKSTPDDPLMSSRGSSTSRGSDRARPEILQGDVRDVHSQFLRVTSEFRLGVGPVGGRPSSGERRGVQQTSSTAESPRREPSPCHLRMLARWAGEVSVCAPDRCWVACITNICRRPRRRDRVIAEHRLPAKSR